MGFIRLEWGRLPTGEPVTLFTLSNKNGMQVSITNFGATVTSIQVPNKNGEPRELTIGFNTLQEYLDADFYAGSIVGRYANRIHGGRFNLEGTEYRVTQNEGENQLHGGNKGFDKVLWEDVRTEETDAKLELSYLSSDGEEGYPGNLDVRVSYSITEDNELHIDYRATTDRTTVINLSNHTYFNLAGGGTILDHEVHINADHYTPVTVELIPTGETENLIGTPFDFRDSRSIRSQINRSSEQLKIGNGFDHNFVLSDLNLDKLAACVKDHSTGFRMEVYTTQPGIQFYTGNFLDGRFKDRSGKPILKHAGLCLETQHYPDSPNQSNFPSTKLYPGQEYSETTVYKFSVTE
jgi:aldose 1-epimerase